MSTSELATSYAALILADDGVDITADKLQSLITAANIKDVEPILPTLFAKALEGKDVKDVLAKVGNQGGAAINPTATRDKSIAAYYLLLLGGNPSPSVEDVKGVVEAGGVKPDMKSLSKLDDYVLKPRASINRAIGKSKL